MHIVRLRDGIMAFFILGYMLTFPGTHVKAVDTRNVKASLKKMANNKEMKAIENPNLNEFLEIHAKPKVTYNSPMFDLIMDDRYPFKPPIRKAPFSSTGEPLPMPQKYRVESEKVLLLNPSTFRITIKLKSCDILEEAIKRYSRIIAYTTIEEHYEFLYNLNDKLHVYHENKVASKYNHVSEMKNMDIQVSGDDCGYPHVNMDESYNLSVTENGTSLSAREVWGALRGLETFSQLMFKRRNTNEIYAKVTVIEDQPRFPHRGILMDTSRHYIHNYTILQVLDGMSYNKFNVLHWHIVDDNSFPYQSEVFPKLSEKGAYHPTLIYTLNDIKDIVEYARLRGIRVVPEFDTPGHTFSWFGYPEIMSKCYLANGQPVDGSIGPINPAQNETYTFMAKLFTEIYDVFPDTYVHLGGDELHSTCWATNPSITSYLQEHGNIPAIEAHSNAATYINKAIGYYFKRLIKTLKEAAGRRNVTKNFIMWEDVLKNTKEVPLDSILQVWMGKPTNVLSLNQKGYRALYSSCWYLDDYKQTPMWPKYYECEPSPYATEAEEKGKLLGGEACLWAEFITTDNLMSMMWPRASVPAERLWSRKSVKDFGSAMMRLQEQRCRMISRGLPTGHISGPDYCIRPKDDPLKGHENEINFQHPQVGLFDTKDFSVGENPISLLVFSQYHHYLPLVNIALTLLGVYLLISASRCMKRNFRRNGRKRRQFLIS